ncbi:MAG: hypothetical protein AAB865_01365 [Patescibacteria group bacterium]
MRLLIRAQDIAWTTIGLSDGGSVIQEERVITRPETILNTIESALAKWKIDWHKLDTVALVSGPGSFTALRSSLTIGNTIAFARKLPIASTKAKPDELDVVVMKRLAKAKATAAWVTPAYGAKALITKPKK